MTPRLALVTAADLPRPDPETWRLVQELDRRGLEHRTVAWTEEGVDWSAFDLVVCRTPWNYWDDPAGFAAWARRVAATTRLENPVEVISWNIHKRYLVDLAERGVPTIETHVVAAGEDGASVLASFGRGEVVVKPAISAGAFGALRAAADSPEAARHVAELADRGDVLVQPFHEGILEAGECSLVLFDHQLSHAVRKVAAGEDYRVQSHYGGTVHDHAPSPAELALADAALAAAPARTAYARVDMVGGPHQPVLMELEVIEPELFLAADGAAARFADVLVERAAR